ncbi:hypothetical protein PCL_00777 [Purpureocillium lilacinum]|uniref:Uncharacterized protein n=1 Tax=Purpureocillium lilacinum TaxID=33203 RepID=A0A2U3E5R2_PURLI|nr:hypothetical protein PCL_00777 [Purpureocillium lilacinum]
MVSATLLGLLAASAAVLAHPGDKPLCSDNQAPDASGHLPPCVQVAETVAANAGLDRRPRSLLVEQANGLPVEMVPRDDLAERQARRPPATLESRGDDLVGRQARRPPAKLESRQARRPPAKMDARDLVDRQARRPPAKVESRQARRPPAKMASRQARRPPATVESRQARRPPATVESRQARRPPANLGPRDDLVERQARRPPATVESRQARRPPAQMHARDLVDRQARRPPATVESRQARRPPAELSPRAGEGEKSTALVGGGGEPEAMSKDEKADAVERAKLIEQMDKDLEALSDVQKGVLEVASSSGKSFWDPADFTKTTHFAKQYGDMKAALNSTGLAMMAAQASHKILPIVKPARVVYVRMNSSHDVFSRKFPGHSDLVQVKDKLQQADDIFKTINDTAWRASKNAEKTEAEAVNATLKVFPGPLIFPKLEAPIDLNWEFNETNNRAHWLARAEAWIRINAQVYAHIVSVAATVSCEAAKKGNVSATEEALLLASQSKTRVENLVVEATNPRGELKSIVEELEVAQPLRTYTSGMLESDKKTNLTETVIKELEKAKQCHAEVNSRPSAALPSDTTAVSVEAEVTPAATTTIPLEAAGGLAKADVTMTATPHPPEDSHDDKMSASAAMSDNAKGAASSTSAKAILAAAPTPAMSQSADKPGEPPAAATDGKLGTEAVNGKPHVPAANAPVEEKKVVPSATASAPANSTVKTNGSEDDDCPAETPDSMAYLGSVAVKHTVTTGGVVSKADEEEEDCDPPDTGSATAANQPGRSDIADEDECPEEDETKTTPDAPATRPQGVSGSNSGVNVSVTNFVNVTANMIVIICESMAPGSRCTRQPNSDSTSQDGSHPNASTGGKQPSDSQAASPSIVDVDKQSGVVVLCSSVTVESRCICQQGRGESIPSGEATQTNVVLNCSSGPDSPCTVEKTYEGPSSDLGKVHNGVAPLAPLPSSDEHGPIAGPGTDDQEAGKTPAGGSSSQTASKKVAGDSGIPNDADRPGSLPGVEDDHSGDAGPATDVPATRPAGSTSIEKGVGKGNRVEADKMLQPGTAPALGVASAPLDAEDDYSPLGETAGQGPRTSLSPPDSARKTAASSPLHTDGPEPQALSEPPIVVVNGASRVGPFLATVVAAIVALSLS